MDIHSLRELNLPDKMPDPASRVILSCNELSTDCISDPESELRADGQAVIRIGTGPGKGSGSRSGSQSGMACGNADQY